MLPGRIFQRQDNSNINALIDLRTSQTTQILTPWLTLRSLEGWRVHDAERLNGSDGAALTDGTAKAYTQTWTSPLKAATIARSLH